MATFQLQPKNRRMISTSTPRIQNMPKPDKFVVGEAIRKSEWELLRLAILANRTHKSKRPFQEKMDDELAVLRGIVDLAVMPENKLISPGLHCEWTQELDEIGNMLAVWIKKTT